MAKIRGAKELRATLKALPDAIRVEATKEVKASTDRMHKQVLVYLGTAASFAPLYHGGAGMQNITGAARAVYKKSIREKGMKGVVGILKPGASSGKKGAVPPGVYLGFFFGGTRHQPARNGHDLAFEEERDNFVVNQGKALDRVLARLP